MREQIKEFWSMRILSFQLESCSVQQKVAHKDALEYYEAAPLKTDKQ